MSSATEPNSPQDMDHLDRAVRAATQSGHRPLSDTVQGITSMLEDPEFDMHQLERLFEADPALTAQALRVAHPAVVAQTESRRQHVAVDIDRAAFVVEDHVVDHGTGSHPLGVVAA